MFGPFRTSVLRESDVTSSYVARPKHDLVGTSPFNARLGEDDTFWRSNRKSRDEFISMEFNKKVQFEMVSFSSTQLLPCRIFRKESWKGDSPEQGSA